MSKHSSNKLINNIFIAENEIKKQINMPNIFDNNFKKYGLLNSIWFKNNLSNLKKPKQIRSFNYKELLPNIKENDYSYIDINLLNNKFIFPIDFVFVTEEMMNLLSENVEDKKYQNKINNYLYEIIIGGKCIIMKNKHGANKYYYIILNKKK